MPQSKHGMNWIKLHKRLAIYARDFFDCVWCRGVFPLDDLGYGLTLDHVDGASNAASNLVTACGSCNSARQETPLAEWIAELARRRGERAASIRARLERQLAAPLLPTAAAVELARLRVPKYHTGRGARYK